ncbi:hypothetical protein EDB84DRAFT_1447727, partial [Lactarius hengduanensis]
PNISVPALPPADVVACPTSGATKHPTGTEDEGGGLLRGTQMSSFGRKRKLRNMCDVSACLCGNSAALSAAQTAGDEVVCCRVVGCETKWYHTTCVGLSFSPKNWTCEVCQSDMGMLKWRHPLFAFFHCSPTHPHQRVTYLCFLTTPSPELFFAAMDPAYQNKKIVDLSDKELNTLEFLGKSLKQFLNYLNGLLLPYIYWHGDMK